MDTSEGGHSNGAWAWNGSAACQALVVQGAFRPPVMAPGEFLSKTAPFRGAPGVSVQGDPLTFAPLHFALALMQEVSC
jgi:hypothetical protein